MMLCTYIPLKISFIVCFFSVMKTRNRSRYPGVGSGDGADREKYTVRIHRGYGNDGRRIGWFSGMM
jgi:hypothetical protein